MESKAAVLYCVFPANNWGVLLKSVERFTVEREVADFITVTVLILKTTEQ